MQFKKFVLVSAFLLPLFVLAELPKKGAYFKNCGTWRDYTYSLLQILAPEMDVRAGLDVNVVWYEMPFLGVEKPEIGCPRITVTTGFVDMIENETEFLLPLAHELGHIKLDHKGYTRTLPRFKPAFLEILRPPLAPNQMRIGGSVIEIDLALKERQEIEADDFAAETLLRLGANPCDSKMLLKLSASFGLLHQVEDPGKKIFTNRLSRIAERCAKRKSP